jgi:hypothetical protein
MGLPVEDEALQGVPVGLLAQLVEGVDDLVIDVLLRVLRDAQDSTLPDVGSGAALGGVLGDEVDHVSAVLQQAVKLDDEVVHDDDSFQEEWFHHKPCSFCEKNEKPCKGLSLLRDLSCGRA